MRKTPLHGVGVTARRTTQSPRRPNGAGGVEEQADGKGSASVEHHSCSVSDGSRVQNCVGCHVRIACRICPSEGCSPFAREIVLFFPRAAKSEPAARTRTVSPTLVAPISGEIGNELQSDSALTDSPVRISYGQPRSRSLGIAVSLLVSAGGAFRPAMPDRRRSRRKRADLVHRPQCSSRQTGVRRSRSRRPRGERTLLHPSERRKPLVAHRWHPNRRWVGRIKKDGKTSTRPVGRCQTAVYVEYRSIVVSALDGTVARFARPRRAVKPLCRMAARRRRGA
jgi:hypothetical protein